MRQTGTTPSVGPSLLITCRYTPRIPPMAHSLRQAHRPPETPPHPGTLTSNSSPATQTELAKDTTPNITSPLLARVGTLQPKFFGLAEAVGCCASRSGWRIDPGPEERPKINCGVRLRCCHPFLKRAASGILSPIPRQFGECLVTDQVAERLERHRTTYVNGIEEVRLAGVDHGDLPKVVVILEALVCPVQSVIGLAAAGLFGNSPLGPGRVSLVRKDVVPLPHGYVVAKPHMG